LKNSTNSSQLLWKALLGATVAVPFSSAADSAKVSMYAGLPSGEAPERAMKFLVEVSSAWQAGRD
jgi:hypothetical protein